MSLEWSQIVSFSVVHNPDLDPEKRESCRYRDGLNEGPVLQPRTTGYLQGVSSHSSQPPVDIQTKVAF